MGDRRNVIVKDRSGGVGVALYTHWGGTELPAVLRKALARKQRWTDGAYLARIIFSEMIRGDLDGETGYGISAGDDLCEGDDERDIVVDVRSGAVKIGAEKAVPFAEFINQKEV